jgi:hypothetical protein
MPAAPNEDPAPPRERLEAHLGLVVAGGLTVVLAVRLMGVANGDVRTAWAILRELGTGSAFVAMALQAVLVGLPVWLALWSAGWWVRARGVSERPAEHSDASAWPTRQIEVAGVLLASVVAVLATSIVVVGAIVAITVLMGLLLLAIVSHDRRLAGAQRSVTARRNIQWVLTAGGLASGAVVAIALWLMPIWLPTESIEVRGQEFTVHVLSETDDELIVMGADSRLVVRFPANEVKQRTICQPRTDWSTTVAKLTYGADYRDCPV